jgi:type IV pilus biogenesis protein CpaD/CtpE
MDTILTGVSAADKTAIEAIHTEYRTKQDALRTEEKAKIDAIIAKYPDLKTKLDALEASRPQMGEGRGGMMGGHRGDNHRSSASGSTAQ